jgi:hypothetical protein
MASLATVPCFLGDLGATKLSGLMGRELLLIGTLLWFRSAAD